MEIVREIAVRYRHNYSSVLINVDQVLSGNAITQRNIPALLKNGEYLFREFGGGLPYHEKLSLINAQKVKLVNIEAVYLNSIGFGGGLSIPNDSYMLGYYYDQRFFIALYNNAPLTWPKTI